MENVSWVERGSLRPNDYNPNKQAPPEARLLKISILEDGWTQPIVAYLDGGIVDGEHRWQTAADPEVAAMTDGLVPVVYIDRPEADRVMSTIRHNRARGTHGVVPMCDIVRGLVELGRDKEQIMFLLQMESEEVDRLLEAAGMPEQIQRQHGSHNQGWMPGDGDANAR